MVSCLATREFFLFTFTWCLFSCVSNMCTFNVLKVCQKLTEYGVHFHRVLPEKRSQTGIMLGVFCKGVLIFEVLNGNRTPVLRFPWRETKKISFNVRCRITRSSARTHKTRAAARQNPLSPCRKRRSAFRTRRTGSSTCSRRTATRPASICCSCAPTSTSSISS